MKIGDKVIICNTEAVSQKTQKPLSGKKGKIVQVIPKPEGAIHTLDIYIVKIRGELLPFVSTELKLQNDTKI